MRFAIFPLHLSKVLRLPRKIDARSCEVLHLSRKIILANRQEGWMELGPVAEIVGKEGVAEDVGHGIELVK